ncbi:MAG: porphobilinogen synthase [Elusimicrobiota bacterium]|jgi:porphobilinogen synthase
MPFPLERPSRLRNTPALRALVRETALRPDDFAMPLFVRPGQGEKRPIKSMPGQFQFSVDQLVAAATPVVAAGVPAVLLFGIPDRKDSQGSGAYAKDGIVQQAVRALKDAHPGLFVITDLCLCEYTDHGHCGRLGPDGVIDNDATLEALAQTAVSQAAAGSDMVAPSAMMDGQVLAIRQALDANGFKMTPILSYAVKYASAFYGPFRDAAESPPKFGDRATHQMDPGNAREALREAALDVAEGADLLMVKPALSYLDVLSAVRAHCSVPVAAYNVSGEYAMVKAAAAQGWIDERRVALEILTSIKRAGADFIFTYHALEAARWLA